MVDLALVQLDERGVAGLVAAPRREGISVRIAFNVPFSKPFADLNTEERAKELRDIFQKNEFPSGKAVLVIPRRFALVRELSIPAGTPEEIAGMIRFQLSKDLPMPIEEVRYATHPTDKGKLLALAVPENVLTPYEEALKSAGVKPSAAYVTTQGLLALVPPTKEPVALAVTLEEAVEVLVTAEDRILMSSNIAIEKMPEAEVGEQISRALMSYLSRSADQEVSKLYLTDTRAGVRSKLPKPIPAETLDLATIAEGKPVRDDLIGVAGLAAALSAKRVPIAELARPPAAVKKFELKQSLRVAGLIIAIAIIAVVWLHVEASDRETEALNAERDLAAKQKQLKVVQKLKEEKTEAEKWAGGRPIWPETLLELSNIIDTKEAYLVSATFEEDQSMTLTGRARRREVVTALRQKLEDSKLLFEVSAPSITPTNSKDEFNVDFTIKAKVQP